MNSMEPTKKYSYPLAVQLGIPDKYHEDENFKNLMATLQEHGFSGVELNVIDPDTTDPNQLRTFLQAYGLGMSMYATGGSAKHFGLSLSSADENLRQKSIEKCKAYIHFSAQLNAGVILGFVKGGPAADKKEAVDRFKDSIGQIETLAREKEVPVLVEATNRYESAVANSLEDAVSIVKEFNNPYLQILPDTFHMNIEETSMHGVLAKYQQYYQSIHISDNNRYFPGYGAIDFNALFNFLDNIGYSGWLGIEGMMCKDVYKDIEQSLNLLRLTSKMA